MSPRKKKAAPDAWAIFNTPAPCLLSIDPDGTGPAKVVTALPGGIVANLVRGEPAIEVELSPRQARQYKKSGLLVIWVEPKSAKEETSEVE